MIWGTRVPGNLGICNFRCITNDKPTNPILQDENLGRQSAEYRGLWGPGTFGICNFYCIFSDKQTNPNLPNDHPNHQIPTYINLYGVGGGGGGGAGGVPGFLGDIILFVLLINKQIQFSQFIILATHLQNKIINMIYWTRGPGTLGICNAPCIFNGKHTNPILPNDNFGHQSQTYSN